MQTSNGWSREAVRGLIAERLGPQRVPAKMRLVTDTSDFFRVEYNDVVVLGGVPYLIRGYEKEGRFGLDDQPKYWVRRAVDLSSGESRIIKLVFHEKFTTRIGEVSVTCFRSPGKEARILDLVREHRNFMHGRWVLDAAGNNVRILEIIHGRRYDDLVAGYGADHYDYFHRYFPEVLDQYTELVLAIRFLHHHGEKHGDIRRDHILFDQHRNTNRWIDFDYNYLHGESMFGFDLHGLGNILIFLTGRDDLLLTEISRNQPEIFATLREEDLNISYRNRVANLRKIYPYIPESLNMILRHFSFGAPLFYETTGQMLDDLARARADVRQLTGR